MPPTLWWLLIGLTLAWGLNWSAMKIALAEFPPWTFRSLCLGFGSLLVFAIVRGRGSSLRVRRDLWPKLALLAFFNVTCWNMLSAYGLTMIDSGRTAILSFTMPVWSVPLSVWLLGEKITLRKAVALALGASGLALLLAEELGDLGRGSLGTLLALGAAVVWAIGIVLQKRWPLGISSGAFSAWTMLLGGLPIFVGMLLLEPGGLPAVGAGAIAALTYSIVIAFAFAYWAWFKIASVVPVTVSSISVLSVPVVGVLSGMAFLGERPSWSEFAALLLVAAAIFVVNLPDRTRR